MLNGELKDRDAKNNISKTKQNKKCYKKLVFDDGVANR